MPIQTEPCDWPLDYGICAQPAAYAALTAEQRAVFERMAATYLWRFTGRTLGLCEVVAAPCLEACPVGWSTYQGRYGHHPVTRRGTVGNVLALVPCECSPCRSLPRLSAVRLPGPIDSVTEVRIGDVVLPSTAYRLDGSRTLVRVDGEKWPTEQDALAPYWTVTYLQGVAVPIGGQIAAAVLAIELWRASCGDNKCQLPKRWQTITRQDVTITAMDSFDDIDTGHTGIWIIDSWVASMMKAPEAPKVYSPDMVRTRARARRVG